MEIIDNIRTSLNAIGKDGKWVCEWILEKPSRLGLGNIEVRHYELICHNNLEVRLEILAYLEDVDTFYEIEIMLNECDANHNGLRALEFLSRERLIHPASRHVTVMVAENLSSTYRRLLEGLPQVVPFIGIEIRVLKLLSEGSRATILPFVIARSDSANLPAPGRRSAPKYLCLRRNSIEFIAQSPISSASHHSGSSESTSS